MPRQAIGIAATDFGQAIGQLVRRAREAAASQELSWTEIAVLRHIAKKGPATTADLARAQGIRPQSMRPILASLEKMAMVQRKPHATDGRQVNIELTDRGADAQKIAGDARRTWLAQAIAQLDEQERETLFSAGEIIRRLLENQK